MLHVIPAGNLSQGLGIAYPSSPTTFSYTGADQTYTVPAGVTRIRVKVWGGGGMHYFGSGAFGGGFSYGELAVSPGDTIKVMVGSAGRQSTSVLGAQYGGGGAGGTGTSTKVTGAGLSGVFDTTVSFANALLIAGGAGGCSYGAAASGGYGGGSSGAAGSAPGSNGGGGTQIAGGAAGSTAVAGSALTGGTAGTEASACAGGGGGYYGGGGSGNDGVGGGGSGYIGGAVTDGSESLTATTTAATDITSAGSGDSDYTAGIGLGKSSSTRPDNAGNGEVYIY